ncbi:MAG: septal ring lytic transglycosylase RlpA family protein [Candidatus Aminicenantes bacterium]|nr:septal ring lytic transglycosylase RlpA family protein [Candidatus Aminicenantes bacterium]
MKQKLLFVPVLSILLLLNFCSPKRGVKTDPGRANPRIPAEKIKKFKGEREAGTIFQTGIASWYGRDFQGRRTANGEIYDMNKLTAAHKGLPFHTIIEVENRENNRKVIVRINDRGPFVKGRIIDLSYKAAGRIGIDKTGTAPVNLRLINPRGESFAGNENSPINVIPGTEEEYAGYYIQAGAFGDEENAGRMLRRLQRALPALSFKIYFRDGLLKVISGQAFSRSKAEEYKIILGNHGIDVFIKEK